jgi:nitrogen regulatory protein PII
MKSIMIIYNQAHSALVQHALDKCDVRGFTKWVDVQGRGSDKGEPHYGTHAWPSINMAVMAIVEPEILTILLSELKEINSSAEKQGLRAFVWEAESAI